MPATAWVAVCRVLLPAEEQQSDCCTAISHCQGLYDAGAPPCHMHHWCMAGTRREATGHDPFRIESAARMTRVRSNESCRAKLSVNLHQRAKFTASFGPFDSLIRLEFWVSQTFLDHPLWGQGCSAGRIRQQSAGMSRRQRRNVHPVQADAHGIARNSCNARIQNFDSHA